MNLVLTSLGFGLITASILAIAAVGFTLQFGVTNILNLAYADLMTASAFVAYAVNQAGLTLWLCAIVGVLFGAVGSMVLNRFIYAPFIRRGSRLYAMIIVTLASGIIIQNVVVAIWSPNFVSYRMPVSGSITVLSMVFTTAQVAIIVVAVVSMMAIHLLLSYTKLGKAMRATASNASLASCCGIRTDRVVDVSWLISGALCGLAGVVFGMSTMSFAPFTEKDFLIVIIAAAILGGVGRPYGAMIGALIIGIASELAALVINPAYKNVVAFGILGIVLLLRPQGIFSGSEGAKEVVA